MYYSTGEKPQADRHPRYLEKNFAAICRKGTLSKMTGTVSNPSTDAISSLRKAVFVFRDASETLNNGPHSVDPCLPPGLLIVNSEKGPDTGSDWRRMKPVRSPGQAQMMA